MFRPSLNSLVATTAVLMLCACAKPKTPEEKIGDAAGKMVQCAAAHMQVAFALHTPVTAGTATEQQVKIYNNLNERAGNDLKLAMAVQGKDKTNAALTDARKAFDQILVSKGPDESAKVIADYSLKCAQAGL